MGPLAEPEHAGKRREAELLDRLAQGDFRLDVHHGLRPGRDGELIGAGDAFACQQGAHVSAISHPSPASPDELREVRELLRHAGQAAVDRQPAGGKPVRRAWPGSRGNSSRRGKRGTRPCSPPSSDASARASRHSPEAAGCRRGSSACRSRRGCGRTSSGLASAPSTSWSVTIFFAVQPGWKKSMENGSFSSAHRPDSILKRMSRCWS